MRLRGQFEGFWKDRIGDYRIIYKIEQAERRIIFYDVDLRKSVYDCFMLVNSLRWVGFKPAKAYDPVITQLYVQVPPGTRRILLLTILIAPRSP